MPHYVPNSYHNVILTMDMAREKIRYISSAVHFSILTKPDLFAFERAFSFTVIDLRNKI